jgi:hypothetical protein
MKQKVLLVSPGGCACTAVINFLKNHVHKINASNDGDNLKHSLPWKLCVKKYKPTHIIYIYGDLDKAARSLFRRNYNNPQYRKLNNIRYNNDIKVPFDNFNQYIKFVEQSRTEPLGMLNHFMAWKNVPNVFFIHYKNIPKSSSIDDFLWLRKGTCSKFILKQRTSEKSINETTKYLDIMKSFTNKLKQK